MAERIGGIGMRALSRTIAALALASCGIVAIAGAARAADDDYPNHPVRWLVGYPPGGSTDICARLIGQYLAEHLHQQFAVENKPGAGNNLATEIAAHAPPDGYTVFLVNPANAINASLYKNLPFDFIRDMTPVAGFIGVPTVAAAVTGYEASAWFGMAVPKGTPRAVIDKLNREVNNALADPGMQAKFAEFGGILIPGTPEDFGKVIADETAKWAKVVKT